MLIESCMTMLTNITRMLPIASPDIEQKWIFVMYTAILYRQVQVWLDSTMVLESCLLEKAVSKRHANYTLE